MGVRSRSSAGLAVLALGVLVGCEDADRGAAPGATGPQEESTAPMVSSTANAANAEIAESGPEGYVLTSTAGGGPAYYFGEDGIVAEASGDRLIEVGTWQHVPGSADLAGRVVVIWLASADGSPGGASLTIGYETWVAATRPTVWAPTKKLASQDGSNPHP